jgi:hypothetical protein
MQAIGMGLIDPAYAQAAQAQLGQQRSAQQQQQSAQDEFFSRRGLSGSAAQLNRQNSLANQFGSQNQALVANMALQGLSRNDQMLQGSLGARGQQAQLGLSGASLQSQLANQQAGLSMNRANLGNMATQQQAGLAMNRANLGNQATQTQANLYGQQAGLYGQQAGLTQQQFANQMAGYQSQNQAQQAMLEAKTAGLQNLTIPMQLQIAQLAAQNAGKSTDSGGGGGGLFGK